MSVVLSLGDQFRIVTAVFAVFVVCVASLTATKTHSDLGEMVTTFVTLYGDSVWTSMFVFCIWMFFSKKILNALTNHFVRSVDLVVIPFWTVT